MSKANHTLTQSKLTFHPMPRACINSLNIAIFLRKRAKKNKLKERCTERKIQKEHFFLRQQQQSWDIYYKIPFPCTLLLFLQYVH